MGKYDIFIAYHGDEETGSLVEANTLYNFLNSFHKASGDPLTVFFCPVTGRGLSFGETPLYVQKSKIFLLVANEKIPTQDDGIIDKYDEDDERKRLYEEINAFQESDNYRKSFLDTARVIITGRLTYKKAGKLHPIFNGKQHFLMEREQDKELLISFISSVLKEEIIQGDKIENKKNCFNFGSIVSFGRYKGMPLRWKCCSETQGKVILINENIVDSMPYNNNFVECNWANSSIRSFLNNDFYEVAFSDEEKKMIICVITHTEDNPKYGTPGGEDVSDRVFLLSINEVNYYLKTDKEREKKPTDYAKRNGAYCNRKNKNGYWWLRNTGYHSTGACGVDDYGYVSRSGNGVIDNSNGIVPAIWIKV